MVFLASYSSVVYGFCKVFKNVVVAFCDFLVLFLETGPCVSWISVTPIMLNVDFLPSSFYKLWKLVLEKSPGMFILRVQRVLAAAAPLMFLPCPHFLLEWSALWNFQLMFSIPLVFLTGEHLGQFGILWSFRHQCFFLLSLSQADII